MEKAYIEIFDTRELMKEITIADVVERQNGGRTITFAQTAKNPSGGIGEKTANHVININKEQNEQDAYEMMLEKNGDKVKKRRFEVMFNPASLSLVAKTESEYSINSFNSQKRDIASPSPKTEVEVGFKIILDDYAGKETSGSKKHTVQYHVEALTAALRNPYLRKVRFSWGKLSYTGLLNKVDAKYTMFSTAGRPVRAEVDIGIICSDKNLGAGRMGQWGSHYEKAFTAENSDSKGRQVAEFAGKVKRILNI